MSSESGTTGIRETVGSVYGLVRSLVIGALLSGFLLGWAGFWVLVARIHYLHGNWAGVLLSGALGLAPAVALVVWGVSAGGIGTRLGKTVETLTPSSTARTSRD